MENTKTYPKLKKAPAYRFVAFIIMTLVYILTYAGLQVFNSAGTQIMETFQIGESFLSVLSACGLLTMAIFSLFVFPLLSAKIGDKAACLAGLIVIVVSGLLYLVIPESLPALVAVRLLQGMGMGIINPASMGMEAVWFPVKERALSAGCMSACYGLSCTLVTQYTYRTGLAQWSVGKACGVMLTAFGIVMFLLVLFVYKDIMKKYGVSIIDEAIEGYVPQGEITDAQREQWAKASGRKVFQMPANMKEAFRFPGCWLTYFGCFFYASVLLSGLSFVLPLYFPAMGYDAKASAAILSMTFLGHIISSPIFGIISDRVFKGRRTEVTMMAFWGGAVLWIIFHGMVSAQAAIPILTVFAFICYFVVTLAAGVYYVIPVEIVKPEFATKNMSICLVFANIGGIVSQLIAGALIQNINALAGLVYVICCMVAVGLINLVLHIKYRC
jgi:Sugar phosphate permease